MEDIRVVRDLLGLADSEAVVALLLVALLHGLAVELLRRVGVATAAVPAVPGAGRHGLDTEAR